MGNLGQQFYEENEGYHVVLPHSQIPEFNTFLYAHL